MNNRKILVVDDEASLRAALFRIFTRKGHQVFTASSLQEAETIIMSEIQIDLCFVDVKLPDGDGIDLLHLTKQKYKNAAVIVMTGFANVELAVKATKLGAYQFVTKPFNIEEVVQLGENALSHRELTSENTNLKQQLQKKYQFNNIIGKSEKIIQVLKMVEKIADTDSTVLISGESGTGKELIAKAIHYNSSRNNNAFVPINCGAIPSELLESELFGHIKGSFTGAINSRQGRFELANHGSLFLDEIGDLNPNLQVKLLRVLQEKCFEPVGSAKTIHSDVRVIAATNVNLSEAVRNGKFREDLFYRLNVIPIYIPALRERSEDIPCLIKHFIDHFNNTKNRNITGVEPEALNMMINYGWPGNIRELENLIERISILKSDGIITAQDLPDYFKDKRVVISDVSNITQVPNGGIDFNTAVDSFENELILNALNKTGWNRNQAALLLSLNRTTLVEKIKKKGLKPPPDIIDTLK